MFREPRGWVLALKSLHRGAGQTLRNEAPARSGSGHKAPFAHRASRTETLPNTLAHDPPRRRRFGGGGGSPEFEMIPALADNPDVRKIGAGAGGAPQRMAHPCLGGCDIPQTGTAGEHSQRAHLRHALPPDLGRSWPRGRWTPAWTQGHGRQHEPDGHPARSGASLLYATAIAWWLHGAEDRHFSQRLIFFRVLGPIGTVQGMIYAFFLPCVFDSPIPGCRLQSCANR